MDAMTLAATLVRGHEGLELMPYHCPQGQLTIGYGRNLEDRGISREEAEYLLRNDLATARDDARALAGAAWADLNHVRQAVLIDMALNMGRPTLAGFRRMWAALGRADHAAAAAEMLDSRWAGQVGWRAVRLAEMMRTGRT